MKTDGHGKWIDEAMNRPGAKGGLHRSLGIPASKTIPAKKLTQALHSKDPKTRKEAQMAKNMKGGG